MTATDMLPNPFAEIEPPADPALSDVVAAIEAELAAFIEKPPLFLSDEFAERIQGTKKPPA